MRLAAEAWERERPAEQGRVASRGPRVCHAGARSPERARRRGAEGPALAAGARKDASTLPKLRTPSQ